MSYSIHLIAREPFAFSFYLERNVLKKTEYNLPMRKMHWKWTWSTWWQFWPGQCRLNTTDVTFSCFIYLFIWFCFLYCVVTIHNAVFVYSKHRQSFLCPHHYHHRPNNDRVWLDCCWTPEHLPTYVSVACHLN